MRKKQKRTGKFLGVPYDWRRPTASRLKLRVWNRQEPRLFTPKVYGWGWSINLGRLRSQQKRSSRLHFR